MILSLAIVECRRKVSKLLQLRRIPPHPLPCCDSTASPHSSQADTTPGAVRAPCRFPRLYSSETVSRQLPLSGPRLCWRVFYTMNREPDLSRSVFQTSAKCHRPIPRSVSMEDFSINQSINHLLFLLEKYGGSGKKAAVLRLDKAPAPYKVQQQD